MTATKQLKAWLACSVVIAAASAVWPGALVAQRGDGERQPVTGEALQGLEHLDRIMLETLREHRLPGASLSISVNGKLVLCRGYGHADLAKNEPVRPHTLFNLASCTKAFTGVAACKLVDEGKLNLDEPVFRLLPQLLPERGRLDPRAHKITVRHLLHHAGGFVKEQVGGRSAHSIEQLVRERMEHPLDYDPGTKTHYSNFSFLLLRLVIHKASGEAYERFTEQQVLRPVGIVDMRLDDVERGYLPGEAKRYEAGSHRPVEAGRGELRGGGCWVASSLDVVRFLTAVDGSRGKRILSERAMKEMLSPLPPPFEPGKDGSYNGLGWDVVRPGPNGFLYHKNGGVAGIQTFMEHLPSGVDWALCFNGSSHKGNEEAAPPGEKEPNARVAVRQAIMAQKEWPAGDLFERMEQRRR